MQVDINQQQLNQTVVLLEDDAGGYYLWEQDLQRWRLLLPDKNAATVYQGENYYPLRSIKNVIYDYDAGLLTLMITAPPAAFIATTRTTQTSPMPPPVKSRPGGFFNYEVVGTRLPGITQRAGQFELGYFNRLGVGTSSLMAERLAAQTHITRLETIWTDDFPERMQTLHLGDAINAPGSWGRSLRFAGIQFGTNFGTQPGLATLPPQSVQGLAVLPSTVDVFINNALVSRQNVPPGPFAISNLPVISGAGEVQLVVRDLFGREQHVTQPFYASQCLLREGLVNYSMEIGKVRNNFGINSNDYGAWLVSGTYRRGLSQNLTGEIRGEAMPNQAALGAGGDYLISQLGTVNAYVVGSHASALGYASHGEQLQLGIDRQAQPWSLGARTQWMSAGYTQLGQSLTQKPPALASSFNLSYAAKGGSAIGIALIRINNRSQPDTCLATLSYNVTLKKLGGFSLSTLRNLSGDSSTTVFAMLSISLDASTSASLSSQSMRGGGIGNQNQFTTSIQRNLPIGEGYGYRFQLRSDGSTEASLTKQNNIGSYSVDVAQTQGATATQLDLSGGIAVLGDSAFLSRRIDQSFAVARVVGYPGVRVLADNQAAGRTDTNGNALIPRLRAYDKNEISINLQDLPLDAQITTFKLDAFPYYRSGVEVVFPIYHSHGATLTIHLENGKDMPVGASVQEVGKNDVYMVGYDGEVYVMGLENSTRLRAIWNKQSCEFDVENIPSSDPLPYLGVFVCKGITP